MRPTPSWTMLNPTSLLGQLVQGTLESFQGTLDIAFQYKIKLRNFSILKLIVKILQGRTFRGGRPGLPVRVLLLGDDIPSFLFVIHPAELLSRLGNRSEPEDFHGHAGACGIHALPLVVKHGSDTSPGALGEHDIPPHERAFLDDYRGYRSLALVEFRLDNVPPGFHGGIRLEFSHFRHQGDHLQKLIHPRSGFRGNIRHDGIPSPFLGDQAVFRKLLTHSVGSGLRLIHLVHRHDKWERSPPSHG